MTKLTDKRRRDIKKILLDNLISNYDLGNIENGGIGGSEETIIALDEYISENYHQFKVKE